LIFEEKIKFYILEKSNMQDHVLTDEEKEELKRWPYTGSQQPCFAQVGRAGSLTE
jgi:hypothetical protein